MTRLILVELFNVSITYTDRARDLEVANCDLNLRSQFVTSSDGLELIRLNVSE